MEDKPIIIPHCTQNATSDLNDSLYPVRSRLKLETKWDIMSRSDQMQYYSSDKKYQLLALNSAPSLIELWDLSSSPVALASLNFAVNGTKKSAGDDKEPNKYDDSGCQCIAWSHCQRYLFAVFGKQSHIAVSERNHIIETNTSVFHLWDIFLKVEVGSFRLPFAVASASFLPNAANMVLIGTRDTSEHILLDCLSGDVRTVEEWGAVGSRLRIGPSIRLVSPDVELENSETSPPAILSSTSTPSSSTSRDVSWAAPFSVKAIESYQLKDEVLDSVSSETVVGYIYVVETDTNSQGEKLRKVRIKARAYRDERTHIITKGIEEISTPIYESCSDSKMTPLPLPLQGPVHTAKAMTVFFSNSKILTFETVLSADIYESNTRRVKSMSISVPSSVTAPESRMDPDLYLLLVGTDSAYNDNDTQREPYLDDSVCDIRILDGHHLNAIAVMGQQEPVSVSVPAAISISTSISNSSDSMPAVRSSLPFDSDCDTASIIKGIVSSVTAACLVSSIPHSGKSVGHKCCVVALSTSLLPTDLPSDFSNKLLFWQPLIQIKERDLSSPEDYDSQCQRDQGVAAHTIVETPENILVHLSDSVSALPFNNVPPSNASRKSLIGSRGCQSMFASDVHGQHQNLVLGDCNGHLWTALITPRSNFPGPMYPPGFTLMQRVKSYVEREDELDNVTNPQTVPRLLPAESIIMESVSNITGRNDVFIDVGISPYFSNRSDPCLSQDLTHVRGNAPVGYSSLIDSYTRLPLQLVGEARSTFLDLKCRALNSRKNYLAKEKAALAASRKRTGSGPARHSRIGKKRKRPKGQVKKLLPRDKDEADKDNEETLNSVEEEALITVDVDGEGDHDFEIEDDGVCGSTKRIRSNPDDSGDSGADTDNEMGPREEKAATVPVHVQHPSDQVPLPLPTPILSISLSDVLPIPRRVITGDFALRLKKEKELGLFIAERQTNSVLIAERMVQFEREAVENVRKLEIRREKSKLKWTKIREDKLIAKRLAEVAAAAALAALKESEIIRLSESGNLSEGAVLVPLGILPVALDAEVVPFNSCCEVNSVQSVEMSILPAVNSMDTPDIIDATINQSS